MKFTTHAQNSSLVEYVVEKPRINQLFLLIVKLSVLVLNYAWLRQPQLLGAALNNSQYLHLILDHHSIVTCFIAAVSVFILLIDGSCKDSLIVMDSFGVQVSSNMLLYGQNKTRFIPRSDILDIVIQETFMGAQVRFVLVVMIAGDDKLEVVFPNVLPRKDVLIDAWRGSQTMM